MLLVRRLRLEGPLDWQFPAGIVKPCDQAAQVACAEVAAETGIAITVRERIGTRVHPITGTQCEYFLCDYLHGKPSNLDPRENAEVAWVPLSALDRYIDPALIYAPHAKRWRVDRTHKWPKDRHAVITREDKVLLVRRREPEGDLIWVFPGGGVEPGETEIEAVEREVREEVGLVVHAHTRLGQRIHPYTGRLLAYWVCEPLSGTGSVTDTDELDLVAWVAPPKAMGMIATSLYPPVRAHLERLG